MSRSHFVDGAAPEAAATEDASSHSLDPRRLAMRRRLIQRKAQREARADAAPPAPEAASRSTSDSGAAWSRS
jgi:hypothetical protein